MSELAPVMLWTSDAQGHCQHLNRLLREFWGVGEDLATFSWQATMHPDDAVSIGAGMQRAIAERSATVIEGRYRRFDGVWRLLRTDARPRFAPDGTFLGMIGVNVDVTESRATEIALRESEQRLRIALQAGRLGTFHFNLVTGEQQWSRRQFEIFGLEPSDLPPSRDQFLSLVHPDDLHLVEFSNNDIRTEGTFLDTEFRIVRPDGQVRHLVAHALARFGSDGKPSEVIGVNQDVTEQRRSADVLRASEERLRQFGETSSEVLWVRDAASLQWEYLSPAFDRVYGLSRQDVLRGDNFASWLELIELEDRDGARAHIERVRGGAISTVEFRIRRPTDGEVRHFRANAFPMRDAGGAVRQIGGIEADVTEERRSAERLELMVTELQHRTRNLIAVVHSIASQTLKNSSSLDDFRQNYGERLEALSRVQGLLSRSNLEPITIDALVRLELAALHADGKVSVGGPRVVLSKAIVQTLALALHELATNARKHGALSVPEGHIAVTWERTTTPNGEPHLGLQWLETGIRPPNGEVQPASGYGRTLIEKALTYSLGARTEFDLADNRLRCTIELPLKRSAKAS
jgi:PAS domain S-box-containing protein